MLRIGGWIGRGLANGEPMAFLCAALVPVAFFLAWKLAIHWHSS